MPTYSYRCDNGHVVQVEHGVKDPGLTKCPSTDLPDDFQHCCGQWCCGPGPCDCEGYVCEAPTRIVITQPVQFSFRHGMRGDMRDYREDLARFKGDPRAFVDGPRSLQKLIDQTKREGADVRPLDEAGVGAPPSVEDEDEESDDLLREAQAEAIQELAEEN